MTIQINVVCFSKERVLRGKGDSNRAWMDIREHKEKSCIKVSRLWDEVREWHGHIYTTMCKIDS